MDDCCQPLSECTCCPDAECSCGRRNPFDACDPPPCDCCCGNEPTIEICEPEPGEFSDGCVYDDPTVPRGSFDL